MVSSGTSLGNWRERAERNNLTPFFVPPCFVTLFAIIVFIEERFRIDRGISNRERGRDAERVFEVFK